MKGNTKSARNMVLTPYTPQCRICHYSGYSNNCEFFTTGVCPFISALKEMRKD